MTHTHTQGEWKESGATIYCGETIVAVAYCEGNRELHPSISPDDILPDSEGEIGNGWEDAWTNARLISAAPDLLDALEMLMPFAPNHFTECQYTKAVWQDAAKAIAKARGEA